ncbi:sulfur carrier protein ThiS [uncultured Aeromicrobium sp.]|uniref:sulfur carrier protein ThiS n=1 Tax=uncultured Aeromicrobium sp. TaxID=337820 RepID=UPI0025FE2F5D|nr:sulfur carrier protein ThiS [uncultured Aeromicrobium sp.]
MTTSHEITVVLDGETTRLAQGSTLRETVARHIGRQLDRDGTPVDGGRLGVAVAVDGAVVPRREWHEHVLAPGSTIDVVTATQGG